MVSGMNASLIVTRWVHFAAALALTGVFSFRLFVGEPAFQRVAGAGSTLGHKTLTASLTCVAFATLGVTFSSGILWLLLQASVMSDRPLSAVLQGGVVVTVLLRTQVGHAWLGRTGLLTLLAIVLVLLRKPLHDGARAPLVISLTLAAAELSALVWAGHAGAGRGASGVVEQAADALHLLAAGIWLGGLGPLALLLATARREGAEPWLLVAHIAATRFSTLGVFSVASLLATGIANSWFLVGDLAALLSTDYGRWLLLKLGFLVAMVGIASVNHSRLVPRLASARTTLALEPAWKVVRELERNTAIEVGLGVLILGIVGVLGILPPAAHLHLHVGSGGAPRQPSVAMGIEHSWHSCQISAQLARLGPSVPRGPHASQPLGARPGEVPKFGKGHAAFFVSAGSRA